MHVVSWYRERLPVWSIIRSEKTRDNNQKEEEKNQRERKSVAREKTYNLSSSEPSSSMPITIASLSPRAFFSTQH